MPKLKTEHDARQQIKLSAALKAEAAAIARARQISVSELFRQGLRLAIEIATVQTPASVTSEMIQAGVKVIVKCDSRGADLSDGGVVTEIFEAMQQIREAAER